MQTWKGSEVLVDALKAKLQNGLGTRIQTLNAEYDDGVTVAVPEPGDYYTAGLTSIPRAPAVIVVEGPMQLSPEGEATDSLVTQTALGVYLLGQDADRQRLGQHLERLARATIEAAVYDAPRRQLVAVNGPRKGDICAYKLIPTSTTPGRVYDPSEEDSWRGFYLITFQATQLEE